MRKHWSSVAGFLFAAIMAAKTQAAEPAWNPKAAAQYLDARAEEWLLWSGSALVQATFCLDCHMTRLFVLAVLALGEAAAEKRLLVRVSKRADDFGMIVVSAVKGGGPF